MDLNLLFNPSSIAIVGATEKEGKVGNTVARNILELGYQGEVFLVNPKHKELFGRKCHPSLEAIIEKVDLAIIIVPAEAVNKIIKKSSESITNYIVISAGFSEIGEKGKEREEELAKIARDNNLNILGPNCLGFINPKIKLNASFAGEMPVPGNIALISQSGALAVGIMDMAEKENLKYSGIFSIGNKAVIDEADLIEYLADDKDTKVIGIYLEGIKDGKKFVSAVEKYSSKKPIVILKAGKTEKARKAISSHTGALAGSEQIFSAVLEKYAVAKAGNLEDFISLLKIMSLADSPKNEEVIIITNAGGPGVLTTDAFEGKKIKPANLSDDVKNKLRVLLPEESAVENPIDLLGDAREDRYKNVLEAVKKEKAGSVICVLTPQDQTPVDKIAEEIIKFKNNDQKNVITSFIGGERLTEAIKKLSENNIPNFSFPEQAVLALDKYFCWNLRSLTSNSSPRLDSARQAEGRGKIDISRQQKVLEIINKAKAENRGALLFSEAKEILQMYGINVIESQNSDARVDIDFPAVAKVDSDKVPHKTDKQGVVLNINNQAELEEAIKKLKNKFPGENIIIQPMLERQMELIVGIKKDDIFGPIIVYGLGGIYTEVFKLAEFLVPPLSVEEIKKSLIQGKLGFLFKETRGQKPYNLDEIADITIKISQLALEIDEIKEFDINPLLIYNDRRKAVAVDLKIML